jgi:iron complex outermembrane receptor protein
MMSLNLRNRNATTERADSIGAGLGRSLFLACCASVASFAEAEPADTIEPAAPLEEVVVIAQKREENAQSVAMSITPLTATQLENAGVASMEQLGAAVPGLTVMNISGGISPRLRGLGSSMIVAGNDPAVATYVDGVYHAYSGDLMFDLHDLTQITVLKGPQGTLFGRNATGGVLQLATREPTHNFEAEVSTGLDNYLTSKTSAFVGGGITDQLRASISAHYTGQDRGWGKNVTTGEDTYRIDHALTARGKLIYDIGDRTQLKLRADYFDRLDSMSGGFKPFPGYSILSPVPQPASPWDIASYVNGVKTYRSRGASVTFEHDFSFGKLTSITAWRDTDTFVVINPAATSIPTQHVSYPEDSRQFTQEIQLVSPSDERLTWVVGAFYLHNQNDLDDFNINLYGPLATTFSKIHIQTESTVESPAIYAQGSYRISPELRLTLGARYTHQSTDLHGMSTGTLITDESTVVVSPQPVPDSMSYSAPTWRIALDRDFGPDMMGYISYDRGFKSGGFNLRDPANPSFRPEVVDAYEIGWKSELLDRHLRLNAAVFNYEYENIQVSKFTTTQVVQNGASARIYGADVDLTWAFNDEFQVQASAQWLRASFRSFPDAQFTIPRPNNEGAIIVSGDASGKTLPFSPEFSTGLSLDYKLWTEPGLVRFNLTHSYSSGYYGEADNRLFQKAYHLLNVSMNFESASGRWRARLYADNLFKEALAGQISSLNTGYVAHYSSPPLIYGVEVRVAW